MRNIIRFSKGELLSVLILLGLLFGATQSFSQAPSLGDPLFVEDFGNATTGPGGNGTSYSFNGYNGENTVVFKNESIDYIQSLLFYTPAHVPPQYGTWGNPNWGPRFIDNNVKMGSYSIATNSSGYKNSYFYTGYDHTTNTGKGYMLLVDAHSSTTLYFDRIVENLCAGTKFQFSVWVKDINRENNLPKPKITLDIYDNEAYVSNGGAVSPIATHTTDDSDILKKNTWYELKMDFDMPANVSTIRLQIRNAVEEFRGNDLAIDDITFRPMGPPITLQSNYSKEVCVGYDVAYDVEVSQGAYNRYYYQLQRRKINADGNDLEGNDFENVGSAVGPISDNRYSFTFPAAVEDDNYEYRVIAAGDPLTLANKNCRTVSNAILLRVYNHLPVIEAVPLAVCEGDASVLQASIQNGTDADDYEYLWQYENTSTNGEWATVENESSSILNTGPLQETTRYRVQAIKDNCAGQGFSNAVEVKVTVVPAPIASEKVQVFCAIEAATVADLVANGTDVRWYDASGTLLPLNEALLDGDIYYASQTVDGCESAERLAVTVKINDVSAGAISGNQTTCLGTVPAILASAVEASGVGIVSYRWEISMDEAVWEVIAGATEASYVPSSVGQNTFFRRVAISTLDGLECEAYTEPVAVLIADDCDLTSQKTVVDKNNDGLAQAGEQLTYSIQINNAYDRDIVVTVADEIPQHTAFVSSSGGDYNGVNLITWKDVKVPAQSQIAVDFVVVVTDNLTGIDRIENVATVMSSELNEPQRPSVGIDTDPVKSFTATKSADKQSVKAGEELTYTIAVTNTGDVDYDNITVSDNIPAHTTYKAGSASEGAKVTGNALTWAIDVPFGESREVSFTVVVADDLTDIASIRNVAKVTGEDPETPEEPETETPTDPVKSFTATKSADKQSVKAGEELTYTITVTNTGDVDYDNITVSDNIPAHTTYKAGSASEGAKVTGNALTWAIDVPFGESREVSFTVVVADDLTDIASIRNVAKVTGEDPETPEEPETETPTDPVKSFMATKSADKQSVKAGEELTYTIAVTNTGDVDYDNIAVSDTIPLGTTYKEGSASEGATVTGNALTWAIDVPFGESREVSFTVVVADNLTDIASIRNVAKVTGEDPETPEEPETETPTDPVKSFTATKSADKQSVKAGEELTYTITVTNTGDVDYDNITVSDNIPAHTTYKAGSASEGATVTGNALTWAIDVPFGESREVSFTVVVADDLTGIESIRNVAKVTGEDPETPEEPETETPTDPVKSFTATKSADKQSVKAGEELTYTITVTNTGDVDYDNITVSDTIPAHTTYKAGSASEGATVTGNALTWAIDVPFGESREVSFTVVVADDLTGIESVRNVAKVTGEDPETPEEPETETPTDPVKSFTATKSADKQSVKAGEELTYTITVTNTGDVDYDNITVSDNIPVGTTYKEGSASEGATVTGNALTWAIDVPFGESREVSFTVVVADDLTGIESVRNVAKVTGEDPETPEEPETETPTDPVKSFTATKSADKQSVKAGEELTYTITVTNTGDVDYDNITVSDNIPAHTTYKAGSASEGATVTGNALTWAIDVPFGESREVSFTVVVADDLTDIESIRNVAKVTGEDPETPEEPETETPTNSGKQFESVKTVSDATGDGNAQAGEELTYRISVKNTGAEDYKGITVEDEIPAHTTYVAGSATHGGELVNGILSWTIDVPFGEEVVVAFNVQVVEELDGVDAIRNVATVTGGDTENPEIEHPEAPEVPVITGPTVNDDQGNTNQGEPITITVLANDTEGSSPLVPGSVRLIDPSTGDKVTTVTLVGEGTYTVDTDGKVTFTPDADYVGNSTVKYTVEDENGLESNEGTIAIIVEGVAAEIAPTAIDDHAITPYGQAVTIPVLSNDQAGSSPIVPSTVKLIDEAGNRVSTVTIPGEGRYSVNAQGIVTFEPAENFTGTSTVAYEVSDENGLVSNVATITVEVKARQFKIPNVFTPNGDGRNDAFEIVGIEGFDRVEITVVNRWGNEVYRNHNYRNDWGGQGLNEGTYYYVVITHDGATRERYAGWVLIKRQ